MAAPRSLGPYELAGLLGRGGMGTVHRARHRELGAVRAIKVLEDPDPRRVARFEREALALAKVRHPNVVAVHESGREGALLWFAMDLVEGVTLESLIADRALSLREAVILVEKTARGLDALHALGLVHRDVKPSNVVVNARGEPVVIDLGVVGGGDMDRLTRTGMLVGTLRYLAPEAARGGKDVDPRADVWALGCVLFEALAGTPPFDAATPLEFFGMIESADRAPDVRTRARHVPADLAAICARALAMDPAARHARAGELADDLARFLATGGTPPGRPRRAWALAAVALAAIGVAAVLRPRLPAPDSEVRALDGALDEVARAPLDEARARLDELAARAGSLVARPGGALLGARVGVLRGELFLSAGDVASAVSIALALPAGPERAPLDAGIAALATASDPAAALPALARAIERAPARAHYLAWRAVALARLGRRTPALADLDRARELGLDDARWRALVLIHSGDLAGARQHLLGVPGLTGPAFAAPFEAQAEQELKASRLDHALASVEHAVARGGTPTLERLGRRALDRAEEVGRPMFGRDWGAVPVDRLEKLELLVRLGTLAAPGDARPALAAAALADASLIPREKPLHERLLELAVRLDPENARAWVLLAAGRARLVAKGDDLGPAKEAVAAALPRATAPGDVILVALAAAHVESCADRYEPARAHLEVAERLADAAADDRLRREVVVMAASVHARSARWSEVHRIARKADAWGHIADVLWWRGLAHEGLGDDAAALADFEHLLRTGERDFDEATLTAHVEALRRRKGASVEELEALWARHHEGASRRFATAARVRRAALAVERGDRARALALLEAAALEKPADAPALGPLIEAVHGADPDGPVAARLRALPLETVDRQAPE